ncbi:MAG: HigA family addiction module antitoxin [Vampirovibrionia bacterium]
MVYMANPPHPGEILKRMYLDPLDINITDAAKKLKITRKALSEFVNKKSNLSLEMAMRLSKAFDTEIEMWLNMQLQYDVAQAKSNIDVSDVEVIYKAS